MRSTSLLLFTSLVFSSPLATSAADAPASPKSLPGVHDAMKAFVDKQEVSGAVTLVADKAGVLHLDAVGLADIAGNKPMAPDAMMWIASMTKLLTGSAVMMLQDEGKLSVDDPVAKYIPEFANVTVGKKDGKPANLTLKHLMTHTSGLKEPANDVAKSAKVLADLIPAIVAQPTSFEPGTKWSYSQSGINTLGRIIEVVGGKSYPDFLDERLIKPLGMTDTTFYPSAEQAARIAKSYKRDKDALAETPLGFLMGRSPTDRERYPLANGGLFSTAADYAKFLRMVLNKGTLDGKTYLSAKAVEQMTSDQTGAVPAGFVPGSAWGLTWSLVKEPQGVTRSLSAGSHGHGGAYGTQGWIDPQRGLVYVLMIQRSDFKNQGGSDGSPVRQAFQDAAAAALAGAK
ncbi:MAG: estB 3 [Phycisphaerales bacterium]|nr:estB 3 [Phycisphaerales bacterium]